MRPEKQQPDPYAPKVAGQHLDQRFNQPVQPTSPATPEPLPSRPNIPNPLKRDHSIPYGEQQTVELNTLPLASKTMFQSSTGRPQMPEALSPINSAAPQPGNPGYNQDYNFIMSSAEQPAKKRLRPKLPGGNSLISRVLVAAVGLLVLIILVSILKSALSGSGDYSELLSVAQDQTEIIHLADNASSESDISGGNQTFVSTTQLALVSSNSILVSYIAKTGHKLKPTELNLKVSSTLDSNLTAAESSGTFNQDFDQVMNSELAKYSQDLNTAYKATKSVTSKEILKSDYAQNQLLMKQVSAAYASQS